MPRPAQARFWVDCGLRRTDPQAVGARTLVVVAWRLAVGWRARWGGGSWGMVRPVALVERHGDTTRRLLVPDVTLGALALAAVVVWGLGRLPARRQ